MMTNSGLKRKKGYDIFVMVVMIILTILMVFRYTGLLQVPLRMRQQLMP